ncbi:MAG: pyridoxamine 5'-phosphate oxidase family protein, partial [Anaerolineaceae bacterium]|nr:pyridoxamine 5'-phosphate oxidase family protein [Anaerolineaceae bacterium]
MGNWDEQAESIMAERFGKDAVIAMATVDNGKPYVRFVNAYYEDGSFYTITYASSNKMKHIE